MLQLQENESVVSQQNCCLRQNYCCNAPTKAGRKGSHSFHKGENPSRVPVFSLFFPLPLSSELWICLKFQVMVPALNGPWSSGQVQRFRKLVSEADEKMMLSTLPLKEFKVCGFIEIQRWEQRGKNKIFPWLWEDMVFCGGFFLLANQFHTAVPYKQLDTPRRSGWNAKKTSPGEKQ